MTALLLIAASFAQTNPAKADLLACHVTDRAAVEMDYAKRLGTLSKSPFGSGEIG